MIRRFIRSEAFKSLDLFPKASEEIIVRTNSGGALSVVVFVVMTWMLLSNLTEYAIPPRTSHVSVYVSKSPHLLTRFDITLPGLNCDEFGLDFVDVSGELALEVSTDIQKQSLGPKSCRIYGVHVINKVSGEFHIAFGRKAEAVEDSESRSRIFYTIILPFSASIFSYYLDEAKFSDIHRFNMEELSTFNSSHIINHLSFGAEFYGKYYPLDGVKKVVPAGELHRYIYFLQLVPTLYIDASNTITDSLQFSAYEHDINVILEPGKRFWQPGIFFKYDFSPYVATMKEDRRSISHFLTRTCAVLGGIFVSVGQLRSIWDRLRGARPSVEPITRS